MSISQQFEQYSQGNGWLERLSIGGQRARQSVEREGGGGGGGESSERGEAEDSKTRRAVFREFPNYSRNEACVFREFLMYSRNKACVFASFLHFRNKASGFSIPVSYERCTPVCHHRALGHEPTEGP